MKKNILYCLILTILLVSCQRDMDNPDIAPPGTLSVLLELDDMGSGLHTNTRAVTIPSVRDENKVNDLYLLFFRINDNGITTRYTGYYEKNGEINLNSRFRIEYSNANTGNYSVLALANTSGYSINSSGTTIKQYLDGLTNETEEEVLQNTRLLVEATGDSPNPAILPGSIAMSGRASKAEGQQLIRLRLTRCVSRFDIQIQDPDYELESVSIWNNVAETPLWLSTFNASQKPIINSGLFYKIDILPGTKDVKGGYYAFENYQSNPLPGDNLTTCLIVGIRKPGETAEYYRININPQESGQSLKRNFVYQVTIREVYGEGQSTKEGAYTSAVDPNLNIEINNWNLDDEGLILTDGQNTMAVPTKIIRFDQDGGSQEYSIFTQGEGTLSMSPELPSGINAVLRGNQLVVTAGSLESFDEKSGTIELHFSGLSGTIQIKQQSEENHFIKVDKSMINNFPAIAATDFTGKITITGSQNWKAQIYNTTGTSFSFEKNSLVESATGSSGTAMDIFVTGNNQSGEVITAFVLISLENEPGYNRVVVLKQLAP